MIVETGLPHRRTFVPWTEVIPRHYHDIAQRFRRAQELVSSQHVVFIPQR
ncbi:unnamed protein product [Heligmosomoides polygyrus]|uniref:Uncharacterized protein n=1 Tax=Heligmosomoides polygyrus TaxID=6339 RepID=A0A3P7XVN9_HELPZ|nr:unnamed protein product [Heligmosomoides polygyrus]